MNSVGWCHCKRAECDEAMDQNLLTQNPANHLGATHFTKDTVLYLHNLSDHPASMLVIVI
jgi:hypothetical protein